MFSILPLPGNHWEERSLPWVIPWMPVVGALIGLLWAVAVYVCSGMPAFLGTAIVMLTPFVLSGFLHLDGFMDTADAVFSRRNLEERRRILKDAHVGAFAVISLVCLFLIQFGVVEAVLAGRKSLLPFLLIPVVSRAVVGLLMLKMKPMSETGFAATFRRNAGRRHLILPLVLLLAVFVSAILSGDMRMAAALLVESLAALGVMFYLQKHFQGISGDLCGASIVLSELAALFTLALIPPPSI